MRGWALLSLRKVQYRALAHSGLVKALGKYRALASYLSSQTASDLSLSFSDVEGILRFALPNSARKYRPWWANDVSHVQAEDGWLVVGWKVDAVDLARKAVSLSKSGVVDRPGPLVRKKSNRLINAKSKQFEEFARIILSKRFGVLLDPATLDRIPKLFDYVSPDKKIVGDAKFLTLVRGRSLPPAKFSNIAEHVWLLQKSDAERRFLVFGNDRNVPVKWLQKYAHMANDIEFYFLSKEGKLETLKSSA